ncbi:YbaK/EbsC family protein [Paraoerskovia marina]|uniref:YbaK/EbsC family protein n=1 Tax=Paraoerskovia marina TaxID=545619 RepID=UPI000492BCC7|nr:YbaK/EbsC family protein [Paraoerskovia marina]
MSEPALPRLGSLPWTPALDRPDLLADPVRDALAAWAEDEPRVRHEVAVTEIDPDHADTATLNAVHELPPSASANCVLVAGRRGGEERVAAVVVLATTRADVNRRVRTLLDARKASFLAHDRAVAESGMEFGGITPLGLPGQWRVLVDSRVTAPGAPALMGSGLRRSKILLPGDLLATFPPVEVVEDLALPIVQT